MFPPCLCHPPPFPGGPAPGREWTARSARYLHISNFACASGRSPVQHAVDENAGANTLSDVQKHKMIFALGGAVRPFSERMQIRFVVYDYRYFKSVL